MKKMGVKKLAAIATGAALVGTALAPFVSAAAADIQKSHLYDATGAPAVNVVVGSRAAVSDVVWAGNISAALARNAVTTGTVQVTSTGDAGAGQATVSNVSVDFLVGGTRTVTGGKSYKANLESSTTTQANHEDWDGATAGYLSLTYAQVPHLYNSSDTYIYNASNTSLTIKERLGLNPDALFDKRRDTEDLVLYLDSGDMNYIVDLGAGIPANDTTTGGTAFSDDTDDSVVIPWFGEKYLVQTIDLNNSSGDYVRMIVNKAKTTYTAGESFVVEGRRDYAGQQLTVTVTSIVKESDTAEYQATFQVTAADGTVVDTQTSGDAAFVTFEDDEGREIVDTDVYVNLVAATVGTNEGYVELLLGANTVELYEGKGYPYDSDNTDGPWPFNVTVSSTEAGGTNAVVTGITIYNDDTQYDDDDPVYAAVGALTSAGQAGTSKIDLLTSYAQLEVRGFEQ